MTKNEFREKKAAIVASMANLEGDALREKEQELKNLREEFADETAMMQREVVENREQKSALNITKMLREHLHTNNNQFNVREALTAAGLAGKAVDVELQQILEPLHANSALAKLGVKWYTGMPMGDVSIPVMGKGSVSWVGETGATQDGTPAFGTNVVLKPKRLTGFFEISEKMILQDTIGVEAALRREAINALADAYEATVLGNEAGTYNKPAGLFYGATLADATTFAKVCEIESNVEDNCIGGDLKYLLGTKAKADFRAMSKSSKSTQLVMEGSSIDGTPAVVTQNVKMTTDSKAEGIYAYGNFQNLACAVWNDLIFKVDDSISYGNGKIRIYVSGYFDAAVLRAGAFAYGNTRYTA